MSPTPIAPRPLRAGIVLADPRTGAPGRVITLQYNPASITRSFQAKGLGDAQDRSAALRLRGPAVETLRFDAELDATDQLAAPQENALVAREGLTPVLSLLEGLVNPTAAQLLANDRRAGAGTLEIIPMETPLPVLVLSANYVVPVRITDLSFTEEAFDTRLNPIRARASLGMRVLTVDDVGFHHRAGALHVAALRAREQLASRVPPGSLSALGLTAL